MLRNFLNVAFRSALRQKTFAAINITGLSIGLVCAFYIMVWISDEISYDRFHKDGHRIFQVWRHMITDGKIDTWNSLGQPVAETIQAEYPEVETITWSMLSQQFVLTTGENSFRQNGGYASPAFFKVFSFPFLKGDPAKVLQDLNAIVITDRVARSLFGQDWQLRDDVIGKSITVDHRKEFTITGVLKDIPPNSSLQFDVLLPAKDLTDRLHIAEEWYYMCFTIHTKLHEGSSLDEINNKVADLFITHKQGKGTKLFLQPFEDVYLHSTYKDGQLVGGRIDYVHIFSVVALFILLLACINFMNLATARSSRRAREIGVRKVVGAPRRALILQFMAESLGMTFVSFLLALGAFLLLLPAFNSLTGKQLTLTDLNLWGMLAIAAVVGVLSGSYPALYLSAFNPVVALKSAFRQRRGNINFRKGLVVFQFAISVTMIVATIGVFLQLDHIRTLNLGMDREGLIFVPREGTLADKLDVVTQELLRRPGISGITVSGQDPLNVGNNTVSVEWPGKPKESSPIFFIVNAGYDYIGTMGMKLLAGRDFSQAYHDTRGYIVNEKTEQLMGGDVLGKMIDVYGEEGPVVGVVQNFCMSSLYSSVSPTIIRFDPPSSIRLYVRTKTGEIPEALASLKAVCGQFNPGYPFEYEFIDQVFERTYRSETVMGTLANIFGVVSVVISCLGLLGLAMFTVEQRTKEVGIRKVLGATVSGIARLLSQDFIKLVMIGVLIALPFAGYLMNQWLQEFASRIDMPWWLFALAGISALMLAIVTVCFQSIRAAFANPVEILKQE